MVLIQLNGNEFYFNYRGNVLGQTPYEKGNPSCNQYGLLESSHYSGLCCKYFRTFWFFSIAALCISIFK